MSARVGTAAGHYYSVTKSTKLESFSQINSYLCKPFVVSSVFNAAVMLVLYLTNSSIMASFLAFCTSHNNDPLQELCDNLDQILLVASPKDQCIFQESIAGHYSKPKVG